MGKMEKRGLETVLTTFLLLVAVLLISLVMHYDGDITGLAVYGANSSLNTTLDDFFDSFGGTSISARFNTTQNGINLSQDEVLKFDANTSFTGAAQINTYNKFNASLDTNITLDIVFPNTTSSGGASAHFIQFGFINSTAATSVCLFSLSEATELFTFGLQNTSTSSSAGNLGQGDVNGTVTLSYNATTQNLTCTYNGTSYEINDGGLTGPDYVFFIEVNTTSTNNSMNITVDNLRYEVPPLECTTPVDGMQLNFSTTLCSGTYAANLSVNANNSVITCDGTNLYGSGNLITVNRMNNVTISNCNISESSIGIYNFYSTDVSIINNTISNCTYLVNIVGGNGTSVINSTLENTHIGYRGVIVTNANDAVIEGNKITGINNSAIYLSNAFNISIENNIINNSAWGNREGGIYIIRTSPTQAITPYNYTINNNTICNNSYFGLSTRDIGLTQSIAQELLTNNTFCNITNTPENENGSIIVEWGVRVLTVNSTGDNVSGVDVEFIDAENVSIINQTTASSGLTSTTYLYEFLINNSDTIVSKTPHNISANSSQGNNSITQTINQTMLHTLGNEIILNVSGPYCGNNYVESGEGCDGTELNNYNCAVYGHESGTVTCTATCEIDASACTSQSSGGSDGGSSGSSISYSWDSYSWDDDTTEEDTTEEVVVEEEEEEVEEEPEEEEPEADPYVLALSGLVVNDESAPDDAEVGDDEQITIEVYVDNTGAESLTGLSLSISNLPAGVEIVSITPEYSEELAPGETGYFVAVLQTGTLEESFDLLLSLETDQLSEEFYQSFLVEEEVEPIVQEPEVIQKATKETRSFFKSYMWSFLLLLLLPLLLLLKRTTYGEDEVVKEMVDKKQIGSYRKVLVSEGTYGKYSDVKNLQPIAPTEQQVAEAKDIANKYIVNYNLAMLLVMSKKKFFPRVLTYAQVPEALKSEFKRVVFVNPKIEIAKKQIQNYVKEELKKGFTLTQINHMLLQAGWNKEYIKEVIHPDDMLKEYIKIHKKQGIDKEHIRQQLLQAGWNEDLVKKYLK